MNFKETSYSASPAVNAALAALNFKPSNLLVSQGHKLCSYVIALIQPLQLPFSIVKINYLNITRKKVNYFLLMNIYFLIYNLF